MMIEMVKSKIHRATITAKNLEYEGSIKIDRHICEIVNLKEFEKVDVYNINNGARFSTYVIYGNNGDFELNGAAVRLGEVGDKIIIVSYAFFDESEVRNFKPKVVLLDENNRIKEVLNAGGN